MTLDDVIRSEGKDETHALFLRGALPPTEGTPTKNQPLEVFSRGNGYWQRVVEK